MAEKTEKVGNAKAAVQAAKIIQGAATAGLPGAAIATISDPKASFALVKKIFNCCNGNYYASYHNYQFNSFFYY